MGQGERLRAARLQRGWTADDVAAALHRLAAELGEAEPAVERNQVSKWERGIRSPGRYYRGRLCLVFEATPAELGWAPTPRLLAEIDELSRRRLSCQRQQGLGVVHPAGPVPSARAFEGSDRERLAATLRYLWPADRPLVDGLARAGRRLSPRTDTEPPRLALPDLRAFLGALLILLSRSQQPELARRLMRLGSTAAQHAGFLSDVAGRWPDAYQDLSVSESLARESGSGSQLAMALVNKAEVYSRRAHGPQDLGAAVTLAGPPSWRWTTRPRQVCGPGLLVSAPPRRPSWARSWPRAVTWSGPIGSRPAPAPPR